jgi:uncharacterized membrane protein YphA (DoxX/SURF4 family)
MSKGKAGRVILWIVQIWAALAFVVVGIGKFRNPFWLAAFPRWGYSDGFRMLVGVLEALGGLLLAFPRTVSYAAILIDIVMIGALGTLVVNHEKLFPPIFWLIVVSIVGYARRRQAWRPAARQTPAAVDTV